MSADLSARSVSHAEGVDQVRALQRVLYRSAKSDRNRRFHALYDKVARSDVMWRAWVVVAANRGAAGVDGRTIDDIEASGVGEFLDALAVQVRTGSYRPSPLRRVHIPKPGKPGQTRPLGIPCVRDRVVMAAAKTSSSRSSKRTSVRPVSGSVRSAPHTTPSARSALRSAKDCSGYSTPTSRRASITSTTTPS